MWASSWSECWELMAIEPSGEERFLRAEARLVELPYTMLASTKEVMALSCSRRR